jgi:hypothetical protein
VGVNEFGVVGGVGLVNVCTDDPYDAASMYFPLFSSLVIDLTVQMEPSFSPGGLPEPFSRNSTSTGPVQVLKSVVV